MFGKLFRKKVQQDVMVFAPINGELGEPLISFDLDLVNEKASKTITPIIITNTDDMSDIQVREQNKLSGDCPPSL